MLCPKDLPLTAALVMRQRSRSRAMILTSGNMVRSSLSTSWRSEGGGERHKEQRGGREGGKGEMERGRERGREEKWEGGNGEREGREGRERGKGEREGREGKGEGREGVKGEKGGREGEGEKLTISMSHLSWCKVWWLSSISEKQSGMMPTASPDIDNP